MISHLCAHHSELYHILKYVMEIALRPVGPRNFVRLRIESESRTISMWTPAMRKLQQTVHRWTMEVEKVQNSQEGF